MKRKYPKLKGHSLGAAFFDDDEDEIDISDVDLGDEDEDLEESDELEEDDEPEEESEDDEPEEEDGDDLVAAKGTRAQERIRALAKSRKEAEARAIQLQQQLDAANARNNPAPDHAAARQAWLNSLTPADRANAEVRLELQDHRNNMAQMQFKMQDDADRNAFDTKALSNPTYAKYAARVEAKLASLRREQNLNAPREEVLKHLIGEAVLKVKSKPTSKADAKKSVNKHKVKTGAGKSDVSNTARKGKTAKERLEGVRF